MQFAGTKILFSGIIFLSLLAASCQSPKTKTVPGILYTVRDDTLATISPELFGQFMARPSWGG